MVHSMITRPEADQCDRQSQLLHGPQMLTSREDMVRCVEDARLAAVQAEHEAEELRAAVEGLQQEREQLLSNLSGE